MKTSLTLLPPTNAAAPVRPKPTVSKIKPRETSARNASAPSLRTASRLRRRQCADSPNEAQQKARPPTAAAPLPGAGLCPEAAHFLLRLALEDCAACAARLLGAVAALEGRRGAGGDARRAHVDPFRLSDRPLLSVAEDLAARMNALAERGEALVAKEDVAKEDVAECTFGRMVETLRSALGETGGGEAPLDTFGNAVSTHYTSTWGEFVGSTLHSESPETRRRPFDGRRGREGSVDVGTNTAARTQHAATQTDKAGD